jgi:hypothetical protein
MKKDKKNTNNTVDDRERRLNLHCPLCRPNKGENKKTYRKHGVRKPKYKDKRTNICPNCLGSGVARTAYQEEYSCPCKSREKR